MGFFSSILVKSNCIEIFLSAAVKFTDFLVAPKELSMQLNFTETLLRDKTLKSTF